MTDNKTMAVLNDEIPDPDDFDSDKARGIFDGITPDDFIRDSDDANPPGWISAREIDDIRSKIPIPYVQIVPVRVDDFGRVTSVASLLKVDTHGEFKRTLVSGRVLVNEGIRQAIARNISKDLGDMALPLIPTSLQPFTVAEFFPTPGISPYYDSRQHAIALCYVVPISGDCKPQDTALEIEWTVPTKIDETFLNSFPDGYATIIRDGLAWAGAF